MNKNITTKQKVVSKQESSAAICKCSKETNCGTKCAQSKQKLTQPKLNSALRHLHCIDQLSKIRYKNIPEKEEPPLPASKVTQKLNFGASHKVFKNLTPINVNDSLLLPKEKVSIPKKYVRSKEKIPEPDLRDFLEPIEPLTLFVPEPELKLDFVEYEFDVLSNYRRYAE